MSRGTLVPEHYQPHQPTAADLELASIIWGLSLGVTLYTAFTAGKQTLKSWRRSPRITLYMVFVWLEWTSSTTMGVISWCFLKGFIQPSLEYFLAIIILWSFQIHTLMQIIINRIAILSVDRTVVSRIKWGVFFLILLINISVVCIWVPANLQISDELIRINNIWDRIQKGLICIIDAALNFYFIHLVRSQLVAKGLTKYTRLFRFNLFMIGISVILDIMIVTMMSLHNKLIYVQFHPLAYLLKLQIELGMADLIIKIVRATKPGPSSSEPYPHYANTTMASTRGQLNRGNFQSWNSNRQNQPHVSPGSNADAVEMEMYANAIKKTVVAEVLSSDDTKRPGSQGSDDEMISENSSTRRLKGEPMV